MTIQAPIKPTAAETALIDAFGGAIGQLPGDAAITTQRSTLIQAIKTNGLPTRRVENWHYTDLRSLLRTIPEAAPVAVSAADPLVSGSDVLSILNGTAVDDARIEGVTVKNYRDSLVDGSALKGLSVRSSDDLIGRLNGSFVSDGYAIHFPDRYESDKPVEIQLVQGGGFVNTRLPVNFGASAKATIIERHRAVNGSQALVTAVSDITLGEGADVIWIVLQEQGADDTHLGQIKVRFGKNAKLKLYVINAGGRLVRQDIFIDVEGEGSDLTLRGINLLGGDSHTDVTLVLGHNVPHTTSTEIMRNVIFDRAKGIFQGQIRVAPDAQKTDAKMSCNTLLLSDEAEFATKPELEIFADDVVCGHGATVADIDHTHLFYLQSRGIPEKQARGLLVQAFVQETVEELEDETLIEPLEAIIQAWLEKHA
ncbi:Fe-S cluster assembly protein SufD [Rhizobium sp. KVB221]|uniref:Fe-S cluster assembly protein SufD n=1 Tax=Rhizobium setariae TaxID=2801340 RepID=A0A936YNP9_9HYPH|nr:Fe-S cluster assembly protein SufD [Rhizobium setariae]MBL0373840.1 Fe-S cluster assembly protein SufD [Rhizobium setariae]